MNALNISRVASKRIGEILNDALRGVLKVSRLDKVLIGYCVSDMVMLQSALSRLIGEEIAGIKVTLRDSVYNVCALTSSNKNLNFYYEPSTCKYYATGDVEGSMSDSVRGYIYNVVRKHQLYFVGIPCVLLKLDDDLPSVVAYASNKEIHLLKFILNAKKSVDFYKLEFINVESIENLQDMW